MAKQEFEQGDSNVLVRNQVVYGALPQDVIDRMGDTTLALQTTEQNVLPAINELKSNLTDLKDYSMTDEIEVGKWLDGSTPIYRKVFTFTTTSSDSELSIGSTITRLIAMEGALNYTTGGWYSVNTYFSSTDLFMAWVTSNNTKIKVRTGSLSGKYGYIILYYTK